MSNNRWVTKNGRTSKRGLFVDGIWYCDCDTRLPAEKFQVKNGGKNHGRWFFTCQKPQPKRCTFFLWSDDAKVREEAAVLNNSRTEPGAGPSAKVGDGARLRSELVPPQTPKRQTRISQPITPVSKPRDLTEDTGPPSRPQCSTRATRSPTVQPDDNDESFDWSSSADEELAEFADSLEAGKPITAKDEKEDDIEPARKVAKKLPHDSPSKRPDAATTRSDTTSSSSSSTWPMNPDDVFLTPSTSTKSGRTGLLSPGITPAHLRRQLFPQSNNPLQSVNCNSASAPLQESSSLAIEALSILSPIRPSLSPTTEHSLISLLNRHELRTHGIETGRDMARMALQTKETQITALQQRIAALEAERETNRTVIQHLKADIATSPKKPRRPGGGVWKRSEI